MPQPELLEIFIEPFEKAGIISVSAEQIDFSILKMLLHEFKLKTTWVQASLPNLNFTPPETP
jgi:hypothetical protein